jgi:hypothetical protein
MSFFHGFFRQKSFNCGFLPFYGMEIDLIVKLMVVLTGSAMTYEKLAIMKTMNTGSRELIVNYA